MKKITTFLLSLVLAANIFAQTPQGINYQGVARNSLGVELTNQTIGVQLSVLNGSATGTVAYTETHALTTDANGLFTLIIGGGIAATGTFAGINWATGGSKWLKVSLDATGGTSYQLMGTTQLMSVPYALFAGNVTNNGGKQTIVLSDDITNTQAAALIAAEVGPNTQEIKIVGTTILTTVDLSMITTAISIEVDGNTALTNLNLSGLTRCDGQLTISNCPSLSNVNLSALAKVTASGININTNGLTSLNLGALTKVNGDIYLDNNDLMTNVNLSTLTSVRILTILNHAILGTLQFPTLTAAGAMEIKYNLAIDAINAPVLVISTGYLSIRGNSNMSSLLFPVLTNCLGEISVQDNSALTNINMNLLANSGSTIRLYNNDAMTSYAFPVLATCVSGSGIQIEQNAILASVVFPVLANSGTISIKQNLLLTTAAFPVLTNGGFYVENNPVLTTITAPVLANGYFYFNNNPALTSVPSANLLTTGDFRVQNCDAITTVSAPLLTSTTSFTIFGNALIVTINLPTLQTSSGSQMQITENAVLTSVTLNSLTSAATSSVYVYNNPMLNSFIIPVLNSFGTQLSIQGALPSAQINAILQTLVNISPAISGKSIGLGQSPSAPPTGAGLTNKATLIAGGNTVSTN
jgi:hypothetical protein